MEAHIVMIVRFAVCLLALIFATALMIKADDNALLRRTAAAGGAAIVLFNERIGNAAYLILGGILESAIALMGVGFVLILAAVIMLLPLIFVARWIFH